MDRSAAHFDSDRGVQDTDSRLEWPKEVVFIRENAILPRLDTKADACMDVLRGWLEPGVTLSLQKASDQNGSHRIVMVTCLKIWCSKASYAS